MALTLSSTIAVPVLRPQTTIPRSEGKTLAGAGVRLPDALAGNAAVLVVGFSRASQGQVGSWGRRLVADNRNLRGALFFEIPMLAGVPKILCGMIVKKMASSVPYPEQSHFLPLMENEGAWRAVAHYSKPDVAYVVLVDSAGHVRWQTEGDATDTAYLDMIKNLAAITQSGIHN